MANLKPKISENPKLIVRSIITPIIHWSANAPIKRSKLKEVSAFPAFESEKAIPTAGWVKDKKTDKKKKKLIKKIS